MVMGHPIGHQAPQAGDVFPLVFSRLLLIQIALQSGFRPKAERPGPRPFRSTKRTAYLSGKEERGIVLIVPFLIHYIEC